ncbi:MAG: family 16 glycosylhydrolase [Gammaproteobacteria bacterium]|nr:family 16 glycosylhydrolase [Gammaproteobacteria bacterium]
MKMKIILMLKSMLALLAVSLLFSGTAQASCVADPDCPLVWADEFDGSSLDLTKWTHMVGTGTSYGLPFGWGNNEQQYYTTNNTTVSDGTLKITAKNDGVGFFGYSSARIRSKGKGDWTYGRFEMRARLPVSQGMWPAFWMLPTDPSIYGIWAASGEIDIMESTGDQPDRILGTLHYGGSYPDNTSSGGSYYLPAGSANGEFHTYAVEWQQGSIRWYIDDVLYSVKTSWYSTNGPFPAPFDVDFHLLLNLAVGGNLPGNADGSTIFPMDFEIDYVRVYELPATVPSSGDRVFDDMEHAAPFDNGWFSFGGSVGGGDIGAQSMRVPPFDGGSWALWSGWGTGGATGFAGGFGRNFPTDLNDVTHFSFWINPAAGQAYNIEINLQDDDNGDNAIASPPDGADDEFQYICSVGPAGSCAVAGGGWQKIEIPLSSFYDDNGYHFGGNGVLDAGAGGNGQLVSIVFAIIATSGSNANFDTDFWSFIVDGDGDGISDSLDNCSDVPNADQIDADDDGFGNLCDPDLNNDNVVNFLDMGIFSGLFLSADPVADFNSDGAVNFLDIGLIQTMFLGTPGPGAVSE